MILIMGRRRTSKQQQQQQRTTMLLSSAVAPTITIAMNNSSTNRTFNLISNTIVLLLVLVTVLLATSASASSVLLLPTNNENKEESISTTTASTKRSYFITNNRNDNSRTTRGSTTTTRTIITSTTRTTVAKQQHEEQEEQSLSEPDERRQYATTLQKVWNRFYETYRNRIRWNNNPQKKKKKKSSSYNDKKKTTSSTSEPIFPPLNITIEMAKLSALVYKFHTETNDTYICEELINKKIYYNTTEPYRIPTAANDLYCYWYYHDRNTTGTQVLLVSSIQYNYIAIVFAGTDDTTTALTDIDILMKPYGPVDPPATTRTKKENDENSNENDDTDPRYALYNNITLAPFVDPKDNTTIIKVHAGFNYALFHNNLMGQIVARVEDILLQLHAKSPSIRLITTGHSLGGASSILTAVGLQLHFQKYNPVVSTTGTTTSTTTPFYYNTTTYPITSITYGAPRMGNNAWYNYITTHETMGHTIQLWRVVLGWDLVPRLPTLMTHVGHTIQLQYITWYNNYTNILSTTTTSNTTTTPSQGNVRTATTAAVTDVNKNEIICNETIDCRYQVEQNDQVRLIDVYRNMNNNNNATTLLTTTSLDTKWFGPDWWDDWDNYSSWWDDWSGGNSSGSNNNSSEYPQSIAYYNHYGNISIGYAGVPFGWFTKSYLWVPGALWSHSVDRYLLFLQSIQQYDDTNTNNSTNNNNKTKSSPTNNHKTSSPSIWVHDFVRIDNNSTPTPSKNDDDNWIHPLDDDIIHTE